MFGIGGPCDDRYVPPETLDKLTDLWEIFLENYAEWRDDARTEWERRKEALGEKMSSISGWIATKTGWSTLKPKLARVLCLRHEDEVDEEPDVEGGDWLCYDSNGYLCESPKPATERTSLLGNASLYAAISSQGPEGEPDTLIDPDPSIISTSPKGKAPSAMSGKRGLFRSWSKRSRRKSVRFSGVHNIVVYEHVPWEPRGLSEVSRHRHPPTKA